jgi:molybdopterin-guanine dinucleotide biosynthesis protein A
MRGGQLQAGKRNTRADRSPSSGVTLHDYAVEPRNRNAVAAGAVQGRSGQAMTLDTIGDAGITAGGIVLCGGRSTRMGVPKATLPFGPETMLQRVVRLLGAVVAPVITPVVVVAARGQELPELPDDVIVTRDQREQRGPLEGLRAGLRALPDSVDIAYVTSCDVPLLVPGFVSRMIDLLGVHDIAAMEIDGFSHPLPAVYRRDTLPRVESLLAEDKLRLGLLLDSVRTRRVQPAEMTSVDPRLYTLRNLNTREDYLDTLSEAGLPRET